MHVSSTFIEIVTSLSVEQENKQMFSTPEGSGDAQGTFLDAYMQQG